VSQALLDLLHWPAIPVLGILAASRENLSSIKHVGTLELHFKKLRVTSGSLTLKHQKNAGA
jgi:hypothetical protein